MGAAGTAVTVTLRTGAAGNGRFLNRWDTSARAAATRAQTRSCKRRLGGGGQERCTLTDRNMSGITEALIDSSLVPEISDIYTGC
jgi:hypothetical protein